MALNVLIPSQTLPQDEGSQAFAYGQCLLVSKATYFPSPYEGYSQFVCDAQGAPFCALEASATQERDRKGTFSYATGTVLNDVIPRNMAYLHPVVTELLLQDVVPVPLDSDTLTFTSTTHVPREEFDSSKLFTVTKPRKSDDPTIVGTLFLLTPSWNEHIFEVYCIEVQSRMEQRGWFERWTYQDETFHISGTCRCSRFSVNTRMLTNFMKEKEDAEKNISTFLKSCVYQPSDRNSLKE